MFTIYQISDLHFGKELIPTKQNIIKGFNPHDERIWAKLRTHLLNRIKNNQNEYLVVVTGDLSQLGHIESYRLAKSLIFEDPNSEISQKYGLQLEDKHLLIVPGNHDSYDNSLFKKNNLRTFNNIFFPSHQGNDIYPIFKKLPDENPKFIFMGIDSTYKKNSLTPRKKLGMGTVPQAQLDELTGRLKEINKDTIKVLCLHHCPIIVDKKRDRSLMLKKSQDLLSWITKNNIDFVLCGHLHEDFYDILPLKKLIKFLPSKRGLLRRMKKLFKETKLNDYYPISINGKQARYLDSIAYHYIRENNDDLLDYDKNEFKNINEFNKYLHGRPEYNAFLKDFSAWGKGETGLIMAGSACQENSQNNSYLELTIKNINHGITLFRHKYDKSDNAFATQERNLQFTSKV